MAAGDSRVYQETRADLLRAEAGRNPCDSRLTALVGELSVRSDDFRTRWARHDVRIHTTSVKRVHHPIVGDIEFAHECTPLIADPGHQLLMYSAEQGTPSEDALKMLASWTAPTATEEPAPYVGEQQSDADRH